MSYIRTYIYSYERHRNSRHRHRRRADRLTSDAGSFILQRMNGCIGCCWTDVLTEGCDEATGRGVRIHASRTAEPIFHSRVCADIFFVFGCCRLLLFQLLVWHSHFMHFVSSRRRRLRCRYRCRRSEPLFQRRRRRLHGAKYRLHGIHSIKRWHCSMQAPRTARGVSVF